MYFVCIYLFSKLTKVGECFLQREYELNVFKILININKYFVFSSSPNRLHPTALTWVRWGFGERRYTITLNITTLATGIHDDDDDDDCHDCYHYNSTLVLRTYKNKLHSDCFLLTAFTFNT